MSYLKNFKIMASGLGLLTATTLTACCGSDTDGQDQPDGSNLSVRLDWSDQPEAAPATMALAVFADGAQPVQTAFKGRDGGSLSLPANTYKLIAFNDDTEALFSRGSTWDDFEIYAQETELVVTARMFATTRSVPMARGTEDEQVIFEPDQLWTSAVSDAVVKSEGLQTIVMPMESAITEYNFTVNNVDNLSYVADAMATISGMSASWLPAQHRCSDTHCIIPFSLSGEGSTLCGTIRTFGHCPDEGHEDPDDHANHILTIYVQMEDGSKVYFTSDVTEEMHDSEHHSEEGGTGNTTIPIVIDQLPLPKPITNDNGLQPEVGEWVELNITIPMN